MFHSNYPVLLVLFLAVMPGAILALPAARAAGGDDDYLRAIQAEGNKLEALNRAKEELGQVDSKEQPAANQVRAGKINTADFEQLLNREAPATFKLYSALPAGKRKAVYDIYLREGKLSAAKRKVVEFHLGS